MPTAVQSADAKALREKANEYTIRNDLEGFDAFWADDQIVRMYLEPARVESFRMIANLCADWPGEVIDLGCGCGTALAEIMAADRTGRKRVSGVDYSQSAVRRCRALLPAGRFLPSDIRDTGLPAESFDIVLSIQTLEHIHEPRRAFAEMWRLARPGGRLVITIPNGAVDDWEGHVNFWTMQQFIDMAGQTPDLAREFNEGRNLLLVFQKPSIHGYRIAGDVQVRKDLTVVDTQSQFAAAIHDLFARIRPRRLIETGTYRGTGTTSIIAGALKSLGLSDAIFHSIEISPANCQRAIAHLQKSGYNVHVHNGLSVPRRLLPTVQQIEQAYVRSVEADGLFVDHRQDQRAALYHKETDFTDVPDDLLGQCLDAFDGRPDFVLLDSGGHMGFVEFSYLIERLRGPCHIALDDIHHVKHHRSFRHIQSDPRFALAAVADEKFGFCIAHFTPSPEATADRHGRI